LKSEDLPAFGMPTMPTFMARKGAVRGGCR
jgi:hypothetical protein